MEDKKNHPTLPSNYVTLAQLQERWQKEKERKQKEKQLLEQQQQQQKLHEERERQRNRRRDNNFRPAIVNRGVKQYRPKISNKSEGKNRPAIKVSCENHEKSEGKVQIRRENADQDGESNKLKKTNKKRYKRKEQAKRKPRADKEETATTEAAAQTTVEGNAEIEDSENNRGDKKTTIKSEVIDKSNNLTMEAEQKFGALSVNSGFEIEKQNGRLRRTNIGFHHRYPRNHGGHSHGYGAYGGRFRRHQELQKPVHKGVWVKKDESSDGNVVEIEMPVACARNHCWSSDT